MSADDTTVTTDTPAYYTVTERPGRQPEELVEGRLFVTPDRLVCGAGDGPLTSGYAGAVDNHSGSALRRLFGGVLDPQRFGLSAARSHDQTITVPYASVTDAELLSWSGSELPGTEQTFAVRIDTRAVRGSLVVQLGHGNRNRGSGHARHDRLVDLVRAHAAEMANDAAVEQSASPESRATAGGRGAATGGDRAAADASETVHCRDCGEAIPRHAEVCPACGVPNAAREAGGAGASASAGGATGADDAASDARETVYCRDCGETMPRRAEVCPACGVPNAAREAGDRGGRRR